MLSCFSGTWLDPLVPMKGTLNASACQDILDNSMRPTLFKLFGAGLFQHDYAPVHKARSINSRPAESGMEKIAVLTVCDNISFFFIRKVKNPRRYTPESCGLTSQKVKALIAAKGESTSY